MNTPAPLAPWKPLSELAWTAYLVAVRSTEPVDPWHPDAFRRDAMAQRVAEALVGPYASSSAPEEVRDGLLLAGLSYEQAHQAIEHVLYGIESERAVRWVRKASALVVAGEVVR